MPRWIERPLRAADAFRRDESGVLTIFGVGVFILMMLAGGIALDFMRFENERTRLQHTLDRAVLAAASLNQQRDRREVIQDYFRASGLAGYDLELEIDESLEHRAIMAHTSSPVRSLFLNMVGIDSIVAPASSAAEERIRNLEVSLVLDVSGSMGDDGKITRLRSAAKDFVDSMLTGSETMTSVSIVPYNGKVNIGSSMADYFALDPSEHTLSNCARFDSADFQSSGIAAGTVLKRLANFDVMTYSSWERTGGIARPHCPHNDTNRIVPWSNNASALKSYIGSLNAGGWTAIDMGMKWGTALLDPSTRSRLNAMVGDGIVPVDFVDRPVDYRTAGALKVVVIMTDGMNTDQYDLRDDRRGNALAPIWAYHSVFDDYDGERQSWTAGAIMTDHPDMRYSARFEEMDKYYDWKRDDLRSTPVGGDDAVQLTWHEANSIFGVRYLQSAIAPWDGRVDDKTMKQEDYDYWRRFTVTSLADNAKADANLSAICAAARKEGIVVYTIAYKAEKEGKDAMLDCAGSPIFYYNVEDLNIAEAFHSIQASIHSLRLTL
ncbi:pilus assembly protein [Jannaschia sp. W003]|uniref:pilus assembly protein n=1 Tax=Jannaschia sp. W003 TaxID=2867012 RepID=UPI0021A35922|nr:pilus assembly protein [Jannaschia sp. W003]UWQ20030.1 pilus assembly protein [Jannaschia sp. W003]